MHIRDRDMPSFKVTDDYVRAVKEKSHDRKVKGKPGGGLFPPEDIEYSCYGCDKVKGKGQFKEKDIQLDLHNIRSLGEKTYMKYRSE